MKIVFGMASGLGNAVFTLVTLKALHELGHEVTAYVDGDYDYAPLMRRCRYLANVVDGKTMPVPGADLYLAGHWMPKGMNRLDLATKRVRWTNEPDYQMPEWALTMGLVDSVFRLAMVSDAARRLPDATDWCRDLDRSPRWDVGIIPGCKPGALWERKRYPHMGEVSRRLRDLGLSVALFGQEEDADPSIVGDNQLGRHLLEDLPDALAGCRMIIGTDSGPAHLAASLGIPTVMIFTATSPMKGDPVGPAIKLHAGLDCSPCQATLRWRACTDWQCREIPASRVVQAALKVLEGAENGNACRAD